MSDRHHPGIVIAIIPEPVIGMPRNTDRHRPESPGIQESSLKPGSADLAFLIPCDISENHLGPFAKELTFISRLIQDVSEAVTGQAQPVELEQLSSSIPTVTLLANVGVVSAIAGVVNLFLAAWEKIEKIRRIRAELTDIGMEGTAVEELTEQITTTVDEVVEESTQTIVAQFKGDDDGKTRIRECNQTGYAKIVWSDRARVDG